MRYFLVSLIPGFAIGLLTAVVYTASTGDLLTGLILGGSILVTFALLVGILKVTFAALEWADRAEHRRTIERARL